MNLSQLIALATREQVRTLCISTNKSGMRIAYKSEGKLAEVTDIPGKQFEPEFVKQVFDSVEGLRAVGWSVEIATNAMYFARNPDACGRIGTLDLTRYVEERAAA
jgi:hypothetical protein